MDPVSLTMVPDRVDTYLKLFEEALEMDAGSIQVDHVLDDYVGWDSLGRLSVAASMEEEFGIILAGSDLQEVATVKALIDRIEGKRAAS